ncbi:hypothetical protein GCM10011335_10370 [Aureimonas glaciei]|uniref:SCP domain-containing protein n=2 Tax=Aureimonas glaciei TaxID=1776957 RepID=A0A917D8T8_9HYPH|nr:hypothetical protein GCM10011335_10370 [Aureimonas glaciei]
MYNKDNDMQFRPFSSASRISSRARPLALALCLAGLGACATGGPQGTASTLAFDRQEALASVNAFRSEHGLQPLALNARLTQVAEAQSVAMAARDRMDHNVAGALPARMRQAGYAWSTTSENIGRSYPDYAAAMAGWVRSPGHRANLLNRSVTEIGLGGARDAAIGRNYWTQTFAAPK